MEKQLNKDPIVGQVIEVKIHPNANKLYIAKVDVGQKDTITIIFGGNYLLQPGEFVPVALPGTHLHNGEKIRPRSWRGIKSYGELLSSDELGWTKNGPDEVVRLSKGKYKVSGIVK